MKPVVEIKRSIPAPAMRIYEAWLKPEYFAEWFISGEGVTLGKVSADPKEGGAFLIEMHVAGNLLPHRGVYQRLVPGKELVFTWSSAMTAEEDTLVEIKLEETEEGTELTLRHRGLATDEVRMAHRDGWSMIVEHLAPYLAKAGNGV